LSRSVLSLQGGLSKFEAVRKIRDLAKSEHSLELAQLASRVASAMHAEVSNGDDPFAKVKGLISDMIARLEEKASADASQKAYCDKELSESRAKKEKKMAELEKLSSSIDTKTARSAQLKREVAELQTALGELAASQAAMTKLRAEEKDAFARNKQDLEDGIDGVRTALGVLRDYYGGGDKAHEAAGEESTGIIGLLEVIESDFSTNLAEITATEENAAVTFDRQSKENEVDKAKKEKDVEHKTKEAESLDQAVTELSSDRDGVQSEHDAIHSYLGELEKQCIAKPETYAERKASREAEIAGLKEALSILSEGESLIEQKSSKKFLHRHSVA
jgi:chromosome segregation ATPase